MFQDARSTKIAILANCLLDQNAKVANLARYPAFVPGLLELLGKYQFGIQQMPCPETYTLGLRRFWQVKPQYEARGTRRSYEFLAEFVLDTVEDYIRNGFTVILIGVDGSPSCGINITDSDRFNIWLGAPALEKQDLEDEAMFVPGRGVFIEALDAKTAARGLAPIPRFGLALDIQGEKPDFQGLEIFLQQFNQIEDVQSNLFK